MLGSLLEWLIPVELKVPKMVVRVEGRRKIAPNF